MSYFDDASLVMIPSGYKTSKVYSVKPTDGSGDLTFSRSNDTATRVNSAGLIEKVRTNLVLQSNSFTNVAWVNGDASIAASGSEWSWTANTNSTFHYTYQAHSYTSRLITYSIYAKAGAYGKFNLAEGTTSVGAWFDLSSGTIGSVSPSVTAKISGEGSGWYRVSISFTSSGISNFLFAFSATETLNYTGSGTIGGYIKQAQLENGDIATSYIATTSAAVSVGPVANVPRLDYLNSSCPRLLLEPQRTNLLTYSEQLNNILWDNAGGAVVSANAAISPDGYQNADTATFAPASSILRQLVTGLTTSATYTFTVYVKKSATSGANNVRLTTNNTASWSGAATVKVALTNSWQRVTLTYASAGTSNYLLIGAIDNTGAYDSTCAGNVDVWGAQLEAGAYATSYIPTLGAAVTRGADACSKTGISSLIGQTNGTFFVDVTFGNSNSSWFFSLASTTWTDDSFYLETFGGSNYIAVSTVKSGSAAGGSLSTFSALAGGRAKIAVQYTSTTLNMFINGVKYTGTRTAIPTCTGLYLNEIGTFGAGSNQYNANRFNQVLTFTSTLTDAQCIELTTL